MDTPPHLRLIWLSALGFALGAPFSQAAVTELPAAEKEKISMPLIVTSPSFLHDRAIPSRHTCDGQNVSPQLSWTGIPANAKSLALIVDDPDAPDPAAPKLTWVHWVLYNIPADSNGLTEGVSVISLPSGTLQGTNDWRRTGYEGPCPPIGKHRYFFKLYALDAFLPDLKHPTRAALEKAMQGHVLTHSVLIGVYQR